MVQPVELHVASLCEFHEHRYGRKTHCLKQSKVGTSQESNCSGKDALAGFEGLVRLANLLVQRLQANLLNQRT